MIPASIAGRAGGVVVAIVAAGQAVWAGPVRPGTPALEPVVLPAPDPWGMAVRVAASLVLVLAMVIGVQRLMRRVGGPLGAGTVRLCEIRRVSHQHALYVIEAGGRRLLLGSGLAVLADLGAAADRPAPASFAERLQAARDRAGRLGGGGRQ